MFRFDPEGPEDGVRRGHHCNLDPQEKERSSEETTGASLHQLLPDHMIQHVGLLVVHPSRQAETKPGIEMCTKEASEGFLYSFSKAAHHQSRMQCCCQRSKEKLTSAASSDRLLA